MWMYIGVKQTEKLQCECIWMQENTAEVSCAVNKQISKC